MSLLVLSGNLHLMYETTTGVYTPFPVHGKQFESSKNNHGCNFIALVSYESIYQSLWLK